MSRKFARESCFVLAFEYLYAGKKNELTLENFCEQEKVENSDDREFIVNTYNGLCEHYDEIIEIIKSKLVNYSIDRIYKVDLAILALAVYEIKFDKNLPSSVVINEAVELAKRFSTDNSYKFVNGVLAKIVDVEG